MLPFSVPPLWKGKTAVCIGGGPSLSQDQVDVVRDSGAHVIAINNAYQVAPWADVLYACDRTWWDWHYEATRGFGGWRITRDQAAVEKYPDLIWILGEPHDKGLSNRSYAIVNGLIGGYQAINLAVNFGAAKILLIGFDMRTIGGKAHWHGDHPNGQRTFYKNKIKHFENMLDDLKERNVRVVNCTPGSAITAFPFGDLKDELENQGLPAPVSAACQ